MKRVPCMVGFTMEMLSEVSDTGFVKLEGEFFYSIKNDTLYVRENFKKPWRVKCDGSCRDHDCPVKKPELYYFKHFQGYGTELPKEALG